MPSINTERNSTKCYISKKQRYRLAYLVSHPIQYQAPLLVSGKFSPS